MAEGGRRRFTVDRELVCDNLGKDADERALCNLVFPDWHISNVIEVHKQDLIVDATLTDSCIPMIFRAIRMGGSYVIFRQVGCRDSETPKLDPSFPIWHIY